MNDRRRARIVPVMRTIHVGTDLVRRAARVDQPRELRRDHLLPGRHARLRREPQLLPPPDALRRRVDRTTDDLGRRGVRRERAERDDEILLSDSTRFADKLRAAGIDVELEIFPELWHVFQLFIGAMPESKVAVGKIGGFVREAFATSLPETPAEGAP